MRCKKCWHEKVDHDGDKLCLVVVKEDSHTGYCACKSFEPFEEEDALEMEKYKLSRKLTLNEYQAEASRTANGIENPTDRRLNALLGLIGEIGEFTENALNHPLVRSVYPGTYSEFVEVIIDLGVEAERTKHTLFHKYPKEYEIKKPQLTRENRQEELGDILWYLTWMCSEFGFSLEEVARANIAKLQARYPDGFSVERSINREEGVQ